MKVTTELKNLIKNEFAKKVAKVKAEIKLNWETAYKAELERLNYNETFNEIRKLECNQEELRKVFLLLSIKGFKHANFSLDIITPDAVSIICSYFVESLLKKVDKPKDIIKK